MTPIQRKKNNYRHNQRAGRIVLGVTVPYENAAEALIASLRLPDHAAPWLPARFLRKKIGSALKSRLTNSWRNLSINPGRRVDDRKH
jgi:hypothetical protein